MSGNSIGQLFKVTTFGESHGIALGVTIDGVPPGIPLTEEDLQVDLDRRKPGTSRYTTPRREDDKAIILSGVFEGKTTGTSIGVIIHNSDQRSQDYSDIATKFRPGHADYTYYHKYNGIRDYRGGGRSSARETAMRVVAGAIAKKILKLKYNLDIIAFVSQIGNIKANFNMEKLDYNFINSNPFFTTDQETIVKFDELIRNLKKEGNSIGAEVCIVAKNVPIGLGEPVFSRLDADIACALMGINAVKAVAFGDGFNVVNKLGSENRDEITSENGFLTNNAGGILGGISSGQNITAKIALKPTSSIGISGRTININGENSDIITKGRHDPCVGIRAVPIAEAMMAIVLLDHAMRNHAQNKFI